MKDQLVGEEAPAEGQEQNGYGDDATDEEVDDNLQELLDIQRDGIKVVLPPTRKRRAPDEDPKRDLGAKSLRTMRSTRTQPPSEGH